MKWAYSIQQKIKAAALLAIICVIVLLTNFLGRQHMDKLSLSFSSVYEDRLVVESYIYKISEHLYQKKLILDHCAEPASPDFQSEIGSHNDAIKNLLLFYDKTLLTEEEAVCLEDFKENIAILRNLELQYMKLPIDDAPNSTTRALLDERFKLASANLHELSNIQLKEGKVLNDQSQRIVQGSSLITRFEMAILICIAIVLQVIVLASRPVISKTLQHNNLN
jgi:hypothetical protein